MVVGSQKQKLPLGPARALGATSHLVKLSLPDISVCDCDRDFEFLFSMVPADLELSKTVVDIFPAQL